MTTSFRSFPWSRTTKNSVTEAYSRINSKGEDLDEGDMVHAGSLGCGGTFRFNQEMATTTNSFRHSVGRGFQRKTLIAALKAIWDLDLYKSGAKGMLSKLDSQKNRHLIQLLPEIFRTRWEICSGHSACMGLGAFPTPIN